MARPKKNNADYFPHDADMRNDSRVRAVRRKFGLDGYAAWVMILESLTDADFFELKADPLSIELMSGDFDIDPGKLKSIIEYLIFLGLLQTENDGVIIFSKRHKNNFEALLGKRKREQKGVIVDDNPKLSGYQQVIAVENPQSKLKENRLKENIKTPLTPKGEKKVSKKKELENYLIEKIKDNSFVKYQKELIEFLEYRMSLHAGSRYKTTRGIDGLLASVGDLIRAGMDPVACLARTMEEEWLKPKPEYFLKTGNRSTGLNRTEKNKQACIDFIKGAPDYAG